MRLWLSTRLTWSLSRYSVSWLQRQRSPSWFVVLRVDLASCVIDAYVELVAGWTECLSAVCMRYSFAFDVSVRLRSFSMLPAA